jgi:glyoxalase family protein
VHHVAFRAADDAEQKARQEEIRRLGVGVTDVRDRNYFRSIYFREPGGVLFEIATDGPGFTADESPAELGTMLKLPPQYESMRQRLELSLPPLRLLPHAEVMER